MRQLTRTWPVAGTLRQHQTVIHTGLAPYHPNTIDGGTGILRAAAIPVDTPGVLAGKTIATTFNDQLITALGQSH